MNLIALILAFGITLCSDCEIQLVPGYRLPVTCIEKRSSIADKMIVGKGKSQPFIEYYEGGIRFWIAYDKRSHKITYLSTSDTDFRTEDGYKIGDRIVLDISQVTIEEGWEVYGPKTKDGWHPVFGRNNNKRTQTQQTIVGEITDEGDPTLEMPKSGKVSFRIKYFSKSK